MPRSTTITRMELCIIIDITGSMLRCAKQVAAEAKQLIKRMLSTAPNVSISIILQNDYCDADIGLSPVKVHPFSTNQTQLVEFLGNAKGGHGGDWEECVELALHEASQLSWSPSPEVAKLVVYVGDAIPHTPDYFLNAGRLDWRVQSTFLQKKNVKVIPVQCLDDSDASWFYADLAGIHGTPHLRLGQFGELSDLLLAICYSQTSEDALQQFAEELADRGCMSRSMHENVRDLSHGRVETSKSAVYARGLEKDAVRSGRFQVFKVIGDGWTIKSFVENALGMKYVAGSTFYQWTKSEFIAPGKEIILQTPDGDFYTGEESVKRKLGIKEDRAAAKKSRIKPPAAEHGRVFVRSDSYNRVLLDGWRLLVDTSKLKPLPAGVVPAAKAKSGHKVVVTIEV